MCYTLLQTDAVSHFSMNGLIKAENLNLSVYHRRMLHLRTLLENCLLYKLYLILIMSP